MTALVEMWGAAQRGRPQGIALSGPLLPRCTRAVIRQQSREGVAGAGLLPVYNLSAFYC